jgi:Na+/H+-dicarboxylate symporter
LAPGAAKAMKPVGDTFVNLVKMIITPVIFLTIVLGIANMSDLKKVGRVGGKALLYFEIVTTFALAIGLLVVNITKPGAGLDVSALAKGDVSKFTEAGKSLTFVDFVTHIVPSSASERSRTATCCRWCSSRCCSAWRSPFTGEMGRRSPSSSTGFRWCSSASSPS